MSQFISRQLDGELSPEDARLLEAHLTGCDACQRRQRDFRRINETVQKAPVPAPSGGVFRTLRRAVRQEAMKRESAPASPAFRVVALAAALALAVLAGILARALVAARLTNEELQVQLRAQEHAAARDRSLMEVLRRAARTGHGIAEPILAFTGVQDYLAGQLRWMVTDGDQVEIGVSAASEAIPTVAEDPRPFIVLVFQYVQRRRTGESSRLSEPTFVLTPGEEASVRLRGPDERNGRVFHYRVKADEGPGGALLARVVFNHEADGGNTPMEDVHVAITADVRLKDQTPVLLGASGDSDVRNELYLWATTRQLPDAGVHDHGDKAGAL